MTREELKQIYYLNRELAMWQSKLAELEARKGSRASLTRYDPAGIHSSSLSDSTGNLAVDIADTQKIIEGILAEIQYEIRKVYRHINSIDDSQLRQIVQFRCVDNLTWTQVGACTGITADAARKIFCRAYPE